MSEKEKTIYDCTYCDICKGHYDHPKDKPYLVNNLYYPNNRRNESSFSYSILNNFIKEKRKITKQIYSNNQSDIIDEIGINNLPDLQPIKAKITKEMIHEYRKKMVFDGNATWVDKSYFDLDSNLTFKEDNSFVRQIQKKYQKHDTGSYFIDIYNGNTLGIDISGMILPQYILVNCFYQKDIQLMYADFCIITEIDYTISVDSLPFTKYLNISNTEFLENFNFPYNECTKSILAQHSIFHGNVNLNNITFHDVISFSESIVKGDLNFSDSIFKGYVNFTNTKFEGKISNFTECKFEDEVSFNNSTINGDLNFSGSTFGKFSSFNETKFFGDQVSFHNCKFEGHFIFKSTITSDLNFSDSTFVKTVIFNETKFFGDQVKVFITVILKVILLFKNLQ